MSKGIAFFDFDGTITSKDSLAEFIRFKAGTGGFIIGLLPVIPYIIGFKAGLLDRQRSKEILLTRFFGGSLETTFNVLASSFVREKIPLMVRPGATEKLEWHRKQGHEIVIVSASPTHWIKPWCEKNGFACIATELEVEQGKITGKISGRNCHGEEKVRRINERYDLSAYTDIYAYGDTSGDKPMLAIATKPFYKPFR